MTKLSYRGPRGRLLNAYREIYIIFFFPPSQNKTRTYDTAEFKSGTKAPQLIREGNHNGKGEYCIFLSLGLTPTALSHTHTLPTQMCRDPGHGSKRGCFSGRMVIVETWSGQ